jgi:hypothetical protein
MANVYANNLEISGKAVQAQTIAAMPDVCFTPPQTPATPPGVPIPYPSFGVGSDTENGTSTVFIAGKIVNIKNKSDESKTSGTEAGCAPKKGIISSNNTGKKYFVSWSNDVKFEGEGVIRFTDLATHNHASPGPNTPPWVEIAKLNTKGGDCEAIYTELQGHPHEKSPCNYEKTGKQSEHTTQAAGMMNNRTAGVKCTHWPKYDEGKAPCICMESKRTKKKKGQPSIKGMPHYNKSKKVNDLLDKCRKGCMGTSGSVSCKEACVPPSTGQFTDVASDATVQEHPKTKGKAKTDKQREQISECLKLINLAYLAGVKDGDTKKEAEKKVKETRAKKICMLGVCKGKKTKPCHGC